MISNKVFINLIKDDIYDKYTNHKYDDIFYMPNDNKFVKGDEKKEELKKYIHLNKYIYCICIIYYDNNRSPIEVFEIGIYKLFFNNNEINKEFIYETKNINYIKYILSTYLNAIDNWSRDDFYHFIETREFCNILREFISVVSKDKNVIKNNENLENSIVNNIYKICFSNSFKRLQDKAQVFSSAKGDHYRNRLIHTNEVVAISIMIVDKINHILDSIESPEIKKIDKDIVIAIALGHDIGHTPFGHQGERTLNDIIKDKKFGIIKNAGEELFRIKEDENSSVEIKTFGKLLYEDTGGFKHNLQSARVLSFIENDDNCQTGLSISPEILEGIIKHTKFAKHENMLPEDVRYLVSIDNYKKCNNDSIADNDKLVLIDAYKGRYFEIDPQTKVPYYMIKKFENIYANKYLTGEIVAFADEIAQRCSDIEDAIRSSLISFNEFGQWLIDMKYEDIISKEDLDDFDEKRKMIKLRKRIISYYIEKLSTSIIKTHYKHIYFDKELFNLNEIIDRYIKNKLISSNEISKFDSISEIIISSIFGYYYTNPRLINEKMTKRMYFDMLLNPLLKDNAVYFSEMSKDYTDKIINNYLNVSYYDLVLLKYFKVDEQYVLNYELIELYEKENSDNEYSKYYISELSLDKIGNLCTDKYEKEMLKIVFNEFENKGINITNGYLVKKLISYEQQKIVIRAICDYISGMTDTFALSEYNNLQ